MKEVVPNIVLNAQIMTSAKDVNLDIIYKTINVYKKHIALIIVFPVQIMTNAKDAKQDIIYRITSV